MLFLESFAYRKRELSRLERWPSNILLVAIATIFIKLASPLGLIGIASWVSTNGLGIFNILKVNNVASGVFTFLFMDFAIYVQHYYSHKWRFLWIFHRVHHTDQDLDVTSGLRFHPIEIGLSYIYKILIILFLGASPEMVMIFEITLNGMAMLNHSNVYIPKALEKKLRIFLVTPQMHIIHHSVVKNESDKNFGFNLSIWDYLFKTYQKAFKSSGTIGQIEYNVPGQQGIWSLLIQPFSLIKTTSINNK